MMDKENPEKVIPLPAIVGLVGELIDGQNPLTIFGDDEVFKGNRFCWKKENTLFLSGLGPLDADPLRKILHRAKWYELKVILPAPFQSEYDVALSEGYEFAMLHDFGEDEEEVEAMVWEPVRAE